MTAVATKEKYMLQDSVHYERIEGFTGLNMAKGFRLMKKGDVVESERNLVEVFPNKFRKLTEDESAPPVDMEARRVEVSKLILVGHWTEADRSFLERLSDENFVRINDRMSHALNAARAEDKGIISTLGTECTSAFQRAYDEGFKVFRNAKNKYQVARPGDLNKPLNKEPLDKDGVDAFVDRYLKSS